MGMSRTKIIIISMDDLGIEARRHDVRVTESISIYLWEAVCWSMDHMSNW